MILKKEEILRKNLKPPEVNAELRFFLKLFLALCLNNFRKNSNSAFLNPIDGICFWFLQIFDFLHDVPALPLKTVNFFSFFLGCPVGQVAAYLVPTDAYVPIPTHVSGKNCFKICQCKTRINECESLYCIQQDYCTVHSETDIGKCLIILGI